MLACATFTLDLSNQNSAVT